MQRQGLPDGTKNIISTQVRKLRKARGLSMSYLAAKMQLVGRDVGISSIFGIERGTRFVSDIELKAIAQIFEVSCDELFDK